ncbi:hypothetical protein ACXR2U_23765, partial [Jatrophihabitans sp. YIM 134969]
MKHPHDTPHPFGPGGSGSSGGFGFRGAQIAGEILDELRSELREEFGARRGGPGTHGGHGHGGPEFRQGDGPGPRGGR